VAQALSIQAEKAKQWGQIVAQAWADPAFKARLLADPRGVAEAHGIALPADKTVQVTESTDDTGSRTEYADDTIVLLLPPNPGADLADEALEQMVGGCSHVGWWTREMCGPRMGHHYLEC
jgi:hypothetical protein